MINEEMIVAALNTNPLSLLPLIKNKEVEDYLNNLIPYSSAFEIECNKNEEIYSEKSFNNIPDIISVQNDNHEQRYRIPNGFKGIVCLYNICHQLKINSLLNPHSSIHYHVDCSDYWSTHFKNSIIGNQNYILSELDTWLGNDIANSRLIGSWFKLNNLHTLEFRLGEMTFDYKIILKRIIHCNSMVLKFKKELSYFVPTTFDKIDINKQLEYQKTLINNYDNKARYLKKLKSQLNNIKIVEEVKPIEETIILKKRTHIIT